MNRLLPCLLVATLGLAACATSSAQYSSGSDYLAAYPAPVEARASTVGNRATATSQGAVSALDRAVRQAASIEPTLRFPARIGVARIENGVLTVIPPNEADLMRATLGQGNRYGSFEPIDPVSARMARDGVLHMTDDGTGRARKDGLGGILSTVRIGAARQHLDAVLIYEISLQGDVHNTGLAFADLTIIGGAILPTRSLTAKAVANAVLVDVRNGYRYGSASAARDVEKLFTSWGSTRRARELRTEVTALAVEELMPEIAEMFGKLDAAMDRAQGTSR